MNKYAFATLSTLIFGLGAVFSTNAVAVDGDVQRGEELAGSCFACHGPEGVSHQPDMYPHLAGRRAEDLVALLELYRDGEVQDVMMTPQAEQLSDQDIADLAVYFAEQPATE